MKVSGLRLSAEQGDPGHPAYIEFLSLGKVGKVFLNGIEHTRVVTADEGRNFIVQHKTDTSGQPYLNADRTAPEMETLTGDVRIEMIDRNKD